ncbi:hypothetical protein KHM83_18455, partial [Fusibacter paucivorans]
CWKVSRLVMLFLSPQYIYAICIVTNDYGKTRELFHRGIDKAKEQGKVKSRGLKHHLFSII